MLLIIDCKYVLIEKDTRRSANATENGGSVKSPMHSTPETESLLAAEKEDNLNQNNGRLPEVTIKVTQKEEPSKPEVQCLLFVSRYLDILCLPCTFSTTLPAFE